MELKLIDTKIKKTQFTKFGCGNLTEYEQAKACIDELVKKSQEKDKLLTMKSVTYTIVKHGKIFAKNTVAEYQEELYNQFVGDFFELFAEYFFKTCSAVGQYGIVNYQPADNTISQDWGVDAYGICADAREGETPCVVQVKFRSNKMDEISYTCLAKTGWDGIKNYGLNIKKNHNVILFCNTENGANYLAKDAMGDNLYVISMKDLDKDQTGIKTIVFWKQFQLLV